MIPELTDCGRRVRLPPGRDVVLTPRFASVVDSPTFQRLRNVRQLGPTHLVYPGAVHTRFEHSLGVFRSVGMCVRALLREPSVAMSLTEKDILSVLAAGLLHDLGHYPYAHSLEAVHRGAKDTPRHERIGASMVQTQLAGLLESELGVCPERVASLFTNSWQKHTGIDSLLASIISSAIDARFCAPGGPVWAKF